MFEQRRSVFDSLLLEVIIPWLVSMNWFWALRVTRLLWNREITPAVPLLEPIESTEPVPSVAPNAAALL